MPYGNEPAPKPAQPRRHGRHGLMLTPVQEAELATREFEFQVARGMTAIENEFRELFS